MKARYLSEIKTSLNSKEGWVPIGIRRLRQFSTNVYYQFSTQIELLFCFKLHLLIPNPNYIECRSIVNSCFFSKGFWKHLPAKRYGE